MDATENGSSQMKKFRPALQIPISHTDQFQCASEENENAGPLFEKLPAEIREIILRQLSVQDLFRCRLVNQQWKTDANSVLRAFKKCYAVLRNPCKGLLRLELELKKLQLNMINGLRMRACGSSCLSRESDGREIESYFAGYLQSFPLKYLSVDDFRNGECPVLGVMNKLVWTNRLNLEELCFNSVGACKVINDFTSICNGEDVEFPALRRVTLPKRDFELSVDMRNFLVDSAPNLMEIEHESAFKWNWGSHYNDVCNKFSNVSVTYDSDGGRNSIIRQLKRLAARKPRNLKVFELEICCSKKLAGPVIQILKDNRSTLTSLCICPNLILKALESSDQDHSFIKVKELKLHLPYDALSCERVMKAIDFGRCFPALHNVTVSFCCYNCKVPRSTGISFANEVSTSSTTSIIVLGEFTRLPKTAPIGQAFPCIKAMELKWSESTFEVGQIFHDFPHVDQLTLKIDAYDLPSAYIDALLCGISLGEAKLLRRLYDKRKLTLEDLAVVSIRPSLTNLKHLKELTIRINYSTPSTCLISEVSGILAFSRIPGLTVRVEGDLSCWDALSRVRPYVTAASVSNLTD